MARIHLEKLNTPLDPGTEAGLREHAQHSPKGAAEMRRLLEEPTTACGQGVGVPLDIFANHEREARCRKCNGKAGDPAPAVRSTLNPAMDPIAWETARALVRVLQRAHPGASVPPRLAVEFAVSAVVKTVDNERDAATTVRAYVERDGPLPEAVDTAAVLAEAATELAKRLNRAPPCRIKLEGVSCWKNIRAAGTRFTAIKPDTMCDACAAMWHVSMAEIALRRRAHEDAEDAAEKARAALVQTRHEVEG